MNTKFEPKAELGVDVEEINGVEPEEVEAEVEADKITLMGWFIRDNSYESKLTNAEDFLDEPFSLEVEEILPMLDELKGREEFGDICLTKGAESIYLFSENHITKNYAKMMIMVEEKDLFRLVAETVREESKIYPRPTDTRLFLRRPFNLGKDEFLQIFEELKKKEEYSDIVESRASNKALYLYSTKYMKKAHADSLTEWIEVEAEQNP